MFVLACASQRLRYGFIAGTDQRVFASHAKILHCATLHCVSRSRQPLALAHSIRASFRFYGELHEVIAKIAFTLAPSLLRALLLQSSKFTEIFMLYVIV